MDSKTAKRCLLIAVPKSLPKAFYKENEEIIFRDVSVVCWDVFWKLFPPFPYMPFRFRVFVAKCQARHVPSSKASSKTPPKKSKIHRPTPTDRGLASKTLLFSYIAFQKHNLGAPRGRLPLHRATGRGSLATRGKEYAFLKPIPSLQKNTVSLQPLAAPFGCFCRWGCNKPRQHHLQLLPCLSARHRGRAGAGANRLRCRGSSKNQRMRHQCEPDQLLFCTR
jgi:hypothetical protein